MFKLSTAIVTLAATTHVLAHGGVLSYSWGGQWYWGFKAYNTPVGQVTIQREWDTYDPIQDPTSPYIACNNNGAALPSGQQLTGTAAAGTAITAYWNTWGHNTGPVLTYMANCKGSCDTADANTLDWFKIDEAGLISGTIFSGYWAATKMMDNNSTWTSTIPSCIPAGNYLIRFETIALHSQPAQWYPECAQINVTGGGSTVPANTCKLPGCYGTNDPGTAIDIYSQNAMVNTTYVIPGPPLFTCGGSTTKTSTTTTKASSTTSTKASTTISSTTTTSSVKTSSTSKTSTTTSKTSTTTTTASGATQTQYGQCGGIGYTGPTVCASPYTCKYTNDYYSQCL